jgi:hypothetical protein
MLHSFLRTVAAIGVFVAVLVLLFGLTYFHFGVEAFPEVPLLFLIVGVTAILALLSLVVAWPLNWRHGITIAIAILGAFAFTYGVSGGTVGCTDLGYGPDADYGVTYDWNTNELQFGDNINGKDYRCQGSPSPSVALLGAFLTSIGITTTTFG